MNTCETMRELATTELEQVAGGLRFYVASGLGGGGGWVVMTSRGSDWLPNNTNEDFQHP